ncbi:hypothetical protein DASC09_004850 [Saccharomycopsis crataegensis]|uniref:Ribosomal protein L9 domain-containing protein n=1 Tax=Saccharomycopsis crataegensis TaxID=43959 RepID=A0AAV5QDZ0_9ASCO|nr:hypothetical protein DASC09_004850 [Saccharomycopsis crataegensis]
MLRTCLQKRAFSQTSAAYKVKQKIEVQLLKDFQGIGRRGQIVKVLPSKMINMLHPHNGAAYILEGQPPRIPVVEANPEDPIVKKIIKKPVESPLESASTESKSPADSESVFKSLGLSFSFEKPQIEDEAAAPAADAASDVYYKLEAYQDLPGTLTYNYDADSTGFLKKPITKTQFSETLSNLTGYVLNESQIKFQYLSDAGKKELPTLDFVGSYELIINIGKYEPVKKNIFIDSESFTKRGKELPTRPGN